jgi:cellulose synthase/poly-beta-1,6-N-acetylglucosamine synthase-like glycosyltransferase
MRLLFWFSALTIGYVYVGYPALLVVWAKLKRRQCGVRSAERGTERARQSPPQSALLNPQCQCPTVSIVIAARNEGARLAARIDNLLALDYPVDRRQIIVVSDGSTDDTLSVLSRYGDAVEVVAAPPRGKAAALNAGVARAVHEMLVFADARQMFAPDAVRALVAPFVDPTIGGVTGELLLDCEASEVAGRRAGIERRRALGDRRSREERGPGRRLTGERRGRLASTIADGVGLYWRYEKQLRRLESAVGSTLGATGAIYALRRSLYRPLPPETILDDVLAPMRAVLAGYRVVFSEHAYAFDRAAVDAGAEQRRKIRTLAGNVQILGLEPRLLLPIVNPVWLQYMSHKLGRLVVPYALLLLFAASVALAGWHIVYALALGAQCSFYLLAGYGAWLECQATLPASVVQPAAAPAAGGAIRARLRMVKRIVNA